MEKLKHLQMVILSIMKDIDNMCKENNIEYYLIGGSAIGAIRHKGFIPWDDDLDIIMSPQNYERFLKISEDKLDREKYYIQKGAKDWPLEFSKVKLKGTILEEHEGYIVHEDMKGIYVDIFKMDNVSDNQLIARWQYLCGKYYLCYQLSSRTYKSASLSKRIMMVLSFPLKLKPIRQFIIYQTIKYNNKETKRWGFFYGRTRWKSAIVEKKIFGKPTYVQFENIKLAVPEHYHEYLTQVFGDYMKLPPLEQRKGLHLISVDFGKY